MTANEVAALIGRLGLTQVEIADRLDLHRNTVGCWCREGTSKARDDYALKHLEHTMTTAETIEQHLARYDRTLEATHITGLIAWAWDELDQTYEHLKHDHEQLVEDITYSAEQDPDLRDLPGLRAAAREYLDRHQSKIEQALIDARRDKSA